MKKNIFYLLFCILTIGVSCCSSDNDIPSDEDENFMKDSVDLNFKILGVKEIDYSELGSLRVDNPKTYYHFDVCELTNGDSLRAPRKAGLFDSEHLPTLKLKKGRTYRINLNILKETEYEIEPKFITIWQRYLSDNASYYDRIQIYNHFSDWFVDTDENHFYGFRCYSYPEYGLDRYYAQKIISAKRDETITFDMKRFSYKVTLSIEPAKENILRFECDTLCIGTDIMPGDKKLTGSYIYSFGGYDYDSARNNPKKIKASLTYMDDSLRPLRTVEKEFTIKNESESVISF